MKNATAKELVNMGFEVEERYIIKNGVRKLGLVIKQDDGICPTFYPANYNGTARQKAEKIANQMETAIVKPDISAITDWEKAKFQLRLCVRKKFEGTNLVIDHTVTRPLFDDLETYVRLMLDDEASTKVTKELMDSWHVTETQVFGAASDNTFTLHEIKGMMEMFGMPSENETMFVAKTSTGSFGASALCNKALLEEFKAKHGAFYILPSSIHEVILVPMETCNSTLEEMTAMVKDVNENEVVPEERLSDHAYMYM